MATPRKITATHADGTVFSRKTARTYSHVIIGRVDLTKAVEKSRRDAEARARERMKRARSIVAGTSPHQAYVSAEDIAKGSELIKMGLPALIEKLTAECVEQTRERFTGEWYALAWCGRPDLANKALNEWRHPDHRMSEVVAVPVDA